VRALLAKRAYLHILAAMIIYFLMSYGALVFVAPLMMRGYGMNAAQAGTTFGAVWAVAAVVGSVAGGALADRLALRNINWLARFAGWGLIATVPFYELAFGSRGIVMMVGCLFVATVLFAAAVPSMFSALHVVCGSKRRAFAVAIAFFFANLIGLGLGPVLTGALSDHFGARYGAADGLRYAMMIVMVVLVPAGWLMVRAARTMSQDSEH
jgi:MFS family permease